MKYEPSLVHPLLLHAIETGLQDDSIRTKLRPFLQKTNVTDEELMDQINVVVSEESKQKGKLGAKNARVNSLEAESEMVQSGGQMQSKKSGAKKEPKPNRPDRLMATLEAVQSDIAVLKDAVNSQNAPERERGPPRRPFQNQRRRVCTACQRANQDFCDHCFRCGSSDHLTRGCHRVLGCNHNSRSGKREEAATAGQGVTDDHVKWSHVCVNCGRKGLSLRQCSSCQSVHYCSQKCRRAHWTEQRKLCSAIKYLSNQEKRNVSNSGMYVSHLTPNQYAKVAKLVGKRCMVQCVMSNVQTEALWDASAQFSIVSKDWIATNLSTAEPRQLEELLSDQGLDLKAPNGSETPYEGWIEVSFKLATSGDKHGMAVRFLISTDSLDHPIVGYNVIEELVKDSGSHTLDRQEETLVSALLLEFSECKTRKC